MTAAMAFVSLWAAIVGPPGIFFGVSLGLAWALACLAAIDLDCLRLPDAFTLPLIAAGLAVSAMAPGHPVMDHLAGAALGWASLSALALAYRRLRGVDGIGGGDAKLLGAGGAWLGWQTLPSVLLVACGLAFVWIALRGLTRQGGHPVERIAFGAPLCLAIWLGWLYGPLVL